MLQPGTRLERRVAIKVLSSRSSASSGQRFEQEARAIAALNHPNICTLHDVGHADGTTYLVMERLEGETLQQRLRLGPVPISDCIVGTVAYMSPEQLCGEVLDARSDLFSFGLVLYEMVAARPAFNGATTAMISAAILHEEPRPLRDLQPDVPPELNRIVDKALEKDRDIRTQSAAELRSDLKRMKRASSGPIASTVSAALGVRPRVAGRDRSRMLWAGCGPPRGGVRFRLVLLEPRRRRAAVDGTSERRARAADDDR
jgi:serine/threonine protein kinase